MEIDVNTEVNGTTLAGILGLTARRVQQLAQDGTITTQSRGKFILSDAVQKYIEFRARPEVDKAVLEAEKERRNAEVSLKKAKAIKAVLETQELQGKMHRSEDVADMVSDLIYTIRGMLLALPGRLAVDAAGLTDPAEVSALMRDEVYTIMKELAQHKYDPMKYDERVRKRMSWENILIEDDSDETG